MWLFMLTLTLRNSVNSILRRKNNEILSGLGQMYVMDERFKNNYEY